MKLAGTPTFPPKVALTFTTKEAHITPIDLTVEEEIYTIDLTGDEEKNHIEVCSIAHWGKSWRHLTTLFQHQGILIARMLRVG